MPGSVPQTMRGGDRATLREADFADAEQVVGLARRLGLPVSTGPEVVHRNWESLWRRNPTLTMDRPMPPLGWVLQAEKGIVGFFGNVPARYYFGTRPLLVGVASTWAVEKAYRGQTDELARAYFGQEEVDLCLASSCIPASGRLFHRHEGKDLPQPDYDRVLYWPLDTIGFSRVKLRGMLGRRLPRGLTELGATALSPLLAGAVALKDRRPGHPRARLEPEAVAVADIGDEFDELWHRKLSEGTRLYASRSAAELRWHFESRQEPREVTVLRCRRGGRLAGYLVWERRVNKASGMIEAVLVDLLAEADDADVIAALLAAADESARGRGCHIFILTGFPRAIRAPVERRRPFWTPLTPHSFCYKARSPELHAALGQPDAWYATPFDGDSSLG